MAEQRLITDAQAAAIRERNTGGFGHVLNNHIAALLDTRDELLGALEELATGNRFDAATQEYARAILAQVRDG